MPEKIYLVICELNGCKPTIDWACASFETAFAAAHDLIRTFDPPYDSKLVFRREEQVGHHELYIWIDSVSQTTFKEKAYAKISVKEMPLMV